MSDKFDVYKHITDTIVAGVAESDGQWQMPWRKAGLTRPINAQTRKRYNGVNVVALWVDAQERGFSSPEWATYRQWQSLGAQVRKGETSSTVVIYKMHDFKGAEGEEAKSRMFAKASAVFNANQVDGYEQPGPANASGADPIAAVEGFVQSTGANITAGGDRACYIPSTDQIRMPLLTAFTGSSSSTATEAFYSTLLHELGHWTGAKTRLDRNLTGRFGTEAYAMEEFVAELTSAYLCSDLGINGEPRADHTHYVRSWLDILNSDKRAIFTAASKASQAAEFLHGMQQVEQTLAA